MSHNSDIGYLLHHLSTALDRQSDQVLQDQLGIGFSQFKILMVLERNPAIVQRSVADKLGQTEASISRQIKLMHKLGLLQTQVDPNNRRKHLTIPTAKGTRITREALSVLNEYHAPLFSRISGEQQQILAEILSNMHEWVCQPGRASACNQPLDL